MLLCCKKINVGVSTYLVLTPTFIIEPYLSVFNLPRQSTAEVCLMLMSGLLRGRLREKLKSMPKLNGSGKIKKYQSTTSIQSLFKHMVRLYLTS